MFLWFFFEPVSWGCGVDVRNNSAQELRLCVVNPIDESAEWTAVAPGEKQWVGLYTGGADEDYYRTSVCLLVADAGRRVIDSQVIDGHLLEKLAEPKVLDLLPGERGTEPRQWFFRLDRQGYDARTNSLVVMCHLQSQLGRSFPVVFSIKTGIRGTPRTLYPRVLQVAYSPSESLFAVVHGIGGVGLYLRSGKADTATYQGRYVPTPRGYLYNHCAWSTGGTWLAVDCEGLSDSQEVELLGLYNSVSGEFHVTDIPYAAPADDPWWQSDHTVWVPNGDHAKVVDLAGGSPRVVGQVRFGDRGRFLGVLAGKPVVLPSGQIRLLLGAEPLCEVTGPVDQKVIVTAAYVLVAAGGDELRAYDSSGKLVASANAPGDIRFGSCGPTAGEVYAICDSNRLVKILIRETGRILVRQIGYLGLADSAGEIPGTHLASQTQPASNPRVQN